MDEFINQISMFWEYTMTKEVTAESAIIKLLISLLLGTIIGIERQTRRRSAGMRTFALICIGSTAAMLLSIWIPQTYPDFANGDPGRIAAQIITGIGFLGAGAIIQTRGSVRGLTTAAAIWTSAITGMCVGAGMYMLSVGLTLVTLIVLVLFDRVEESHTLSGEIKRLIVEFDTATVNVDDVKSILKDNKLFLINVSFEKNYEQNTSVYTFNVHMNSTRTYDEVLNQIYLIGGVKSISIQY